MHELFLYYITVVTNDPTIATISRMLYSDASEEFLDKPVDEKVALVMPLREIPYFNYLRTGIILWERWKRTEEIDIISFFIEETDSTSEEAEFPLDDVLDEPMNPMISDE